MKHFLLFSVALLLNTQTFSQNLNKSSQPPRIQYNEDNHQYITQAAFNLLQNQNGAAMPSFLTTLQTHIGTTQQRNIPFVDSWVVAGAYDADHHDAVYLYNWNNNPTFQPAGFGQLAGLFGDLDPFVSITHFWRSDNGDAEQSTMEGTYSSLKIKFYIFNVPNAYQAATALCNDGVKYAFTIPDDISGNNFVFQKESGGTVNISDLVSTAFGNPWNGMKFGLVYLQYSNLWQVYSTKRVYLKWATDNRFDSFWAQNWTPSWNDVGYVTLTDQQRDFVIFDVLGRLCHYLQDMSVPAHAHRDLHGSDDPGIKQDYYEHDYTPAHYSEYNASNAGTIVNPYAYASTNPLHFLMYTTNQIADWFSSNGPYNIDGDGTFGGNGTSDEVGYLNQWKGVAQDNGLPSADYPSGGAVDASTAPSIFQFCFPQAIKATAGLMLWATKEITATNVVNLKNDFNSGIIGVDNVGNVVSGGAGLWQNGTGHSLLGQAQHAKENGDATNPQLWWVHQTWRQGNGTDISVNPYSLTVSGSTDMLARYTRTILTTVQTAYPDGGNGGNIQIVGLDNYQGPSFTNLAVRVDVQPRMQLTAIPASVSGPFLNWSDGSAQNPKYFTASPVSLNANFKGHLTSSVSTATTGSGSKIAIDANDTRYAVYTSLGSVWFVKTNGSGGWTNEAKIGDGTNPAIAVTQNPNTGITNVHVVWEHQESGLWVVYYSKSTEGGNSWSAPLNVSTGGSQQTTPAIASDGNNVVIAWTYTSTTNSILHAELNPGAGNPVMYFENMSQCPNPQFPSIAWQSPWYHLALVSQGNSIWYANFAPQWSPNGAADLNFQKNVASGSSLTNPCIAYDGDNPIGIAWENTSNHSVYYSESTNSGSSWSTQQQFTHGSDYLSRPVLLFDDNMISSEVLLFQMGSHIGECLRPLEPQPGSWSQTVDLGIGAGPSLPVPAATLGYFQSFPNGMWTTGSAAPYSINISPFQSYSGTIGATTWSGSVSVSSTVTVNSGATLTISPSTVATFASGACLTVNGTLSAVGTSSNLITFTFPGSGGIFLSGSGANGSTLNYVNVSGGDIEPQNCSGITIENCRLQGATYGINAYVASGTIQADTIINPLYGLKFITSSFSCFQNVINKTSAQSSSKGITCQSGSNGTFYQNDIHNFYYGMYATSSSSPDLSHVANACCPPYWNNRITNSYYGLYANSSSWPSLGGPVSTSGYNSLHDNTKNIYFSSGGQLYACNTYWGVYPDPTGTFTLGSGSTVVYTGALQSDPWSGRPLPSLQAPVGVNINTKLVSTKGSPKETEAEMNAGIVSTDPGDSLYSGIELREEGKFKDAANFFLSYLGRHRNDQRASTELYNCYSNETSDQVTKYFESLPSSPSQDNNFLLSYLYLRQGNIKSAKQVNNSVVSKNPGTTWSAKAKLNNFYLALFSENKPDAALTILKDVQSHPELTTSEELSLAEDALRNYLDPATGKMPYTNYLPPSISALPTQDGLMTNYPNPFNPTTMIAYNLPKGGHVTLKVYDILGREVRTLVNEDQDGGVHFANFDGSRCASGVYFYRLTAPGINQVRKMLLTK